MSGYTDQASASPTPASFDRLQSAIRWLVYPVLLGGAMALLWALLALGASLVWAPYLAVAIVGPLVVLAERALPYRPGWQASRSDLVDDGLICHSQRSTVAGLMILRAFSVPRARR
jgi:hypothetical protein